MEVRTKGVKFSPTGRQWATASTEGLLIYSLDDTFIFDPYELDQDITPQSIRDILNKGEFLRALINSFRLNELWLIKEIFQSIPCSNINLLANHFLKNIYPDF